ncbi:hypothetical protein OEZ71_07335 [Defluviimonas sp. WL0050]|uniref:Uncharacterized protein n=1 Tax=Albidovulum litorale TaxID=2984134 RepID=A0ABT2ZLU8_9RHOB|nr:hypothetical protein [Defluviimonas sp. WL0050]MCV2872106.1 hypothetical protein [Defluviimonas sp. WL0050]
MKRKPRVSRLFVSLAAILLSAGANLTPIRAIAQSAECDPQRLANQHASVAVFRKLQLEVATLMQAQSEAILEVDHGIVISSMDDGGFFGPTGFLGKRMDKGQSAIHAVLIAGRRLPLDDDGAARLSEIETSANEIIAIGHSMVPLLEAGDIKKATSLYAQRSVPAQVAAVGAAYTMSSGLERQLKLMSLRCR